MELNKKISFQVHYNLHRKSITMSNFILFVKVFKVKA